MQLCRESYCPSGEGRNSRPQGADPSDITREDSYVAFLRARADHNPSSSQNHVTNPARIIP